MEIKYSKQLMDNIDLKIDNEYLQSGIYLINIYDVNSKLTFNKKIIVE